jgi:hypothetical protein
MSATAVEKPHEHVASIQKFDAGCSLWYTLRRTTPYGSSVPERPTEASANDMTKARRSGDELRDHYNFSGGVRGKYAKRYAEGTNVIVLDPDVAEVFKDREEA